MTDEIPIEKTLASLYLDTMKKALTFSLWEEPGIPIETFNYARRFPKKQIIEIVSRLLQTVNLHLVITFRPNGDMRKRGYWSVMADTMIGIEGLDNIQFCVERVLDDNIEGDLIETGAWRGGACIFMRAILAAHNITNRRVLVADSFRGLPKPDEVNFPSDRGDKHYSQEFLAVSRQQVESNFMKYNLLDCQVIFLEGWFKDTLSYVPSEKLSIVRLDGDLYESTWQAISSLYPKLSSGGYCIVDDYHLKGCRQAIDDYREQNSISTPIQQTKGNPVYWRKE